MNIVTIICHKLFITGGYEVWEVCGEGADNKNPCPKKPKASWMMAITDVLSTIGQDDNSNNFKVPCEIEETAKQLAGTRRKERSDSYESACSFPAVLFRGRGLDTSATTKGDFAAKTRRSRDRC